LRKVKDIKKESKNRGAAVFFAALRIIAALVCAFLLYTFLYTISLNQINHGNVVGTAFCVSVILLVILYPWLKKRKPLRIAARLAGAVLLVFTLYCGVISAVIASEMIHGEDRAVAASAAGGGTPQTVIVLGCQVLGEEPSPMLTLRLEKAEEYLRANPGAVCVVTGGMGGNENITEAEAMRRYLVNHGISEERIYTESESRNTTENIRFAARIIAEEELPDNVVVVSECYHIYRGVRQARLAGLNASGICPSSDPVIKTLPSYWLREIFAITRDFIFG